MQELPQFLRFVVEAGSPIQKAVVQRTANTMTAATQAATMHSAAAERACSGKALRTDSREKESELDGPIKAMIDHPPTTAEPATPEDDSKRVLKTRVTDLTTLVKRLREHLSSVQIETVN